MKLLYLSVRHVSGYYIGAANVRAKCQRGTEPRVGPVLAAIAHVGSESAFIFNSARLRPNRPRITPARLKQTENT